jgi:hypothetical protein
MKLLQVSLVITAVADGTRAAVAANYPAADGYLQTNPPRLSSDPGWSGWRPATAAATRARSAWC